MATIVRMPGQVIDYPLQKDLGLPPEERATIGIEVLDWDKWRRWAVLGHGKSDAEIIRLLPQLLGLPIRHVRNFWWLNGDGKLEEFSLEKRGDELTGRSTSMLLPFRDELILAIQNAQIFGVEDAKNLLSPSPA